MRKAIANNELFPKRYCILVTHNRAMMGTLAGHSTSLVVDNLKLCVRKQLSTVCDKLNNLAQISIESTIDELFTGVLDFVLA